MERLVKVCRNQYLSSGCYGDVYRISQRRIVKIYTTRDKYEAHLIREDEIRGSRISKYCLPILEKVRVRVGKKREEYLGVIKKYLPNPYIPDKTFDLISHFERFKKTQILADDCHVDNILCDGRGRPYLIDTQLFMWD